MLPRLPTSLQQERDIVRANRYWGCTDTAIVSQAYGRADSVLVTAGRRGMKANRGLMKASAGCHAGYDSQSLYEDMQEEN